MLVQCRARLEDGHALRTLGLSGDDAHRLRGFQFLSAKPLLLVVERGRGGRRRGRGRRTTDRAWPTAGDSGARVDGGVREDRARDRGARTGRRRAFLADLGLKQSGLDRIIRAAYDLLGYISFFTVGEDECRAWSIPRVTPAVLAAGAIHSDIQRGFIRAEVVACDRLLVRGSLAACRDHGELRLEGKDYPVADGDVITFRHAT